MRFNPENPLYRYYISNQQLGWLGIAQQIGIAEVTAIRIAQRDKEDILKLPVGTYIKIKQKLGIDLVEDYE